MNYQYAINFFSDGSNGSVKPSTEPPSTTTKGNIHYESRRPHIINTKFYCIFIKWTLYLIDKADPPDTPGCWIRYPSGCPNQKHRPKYNYLQNQNNWNHETFKGASESSAKCQARGIPIKNWCGITNIIIRFVEGISQQSEDSHRK